jgi:plastocyanin
VNPTAANVTTTAPCCRSAPLAGRKWVTFAAAVALATGLTAGCASSPGAKVREAPAAGAGGVQNVAISATDALRFAPAELTVRTGAVRITLTDAGSYPHNISFPGLHATSPSVSGAPGQSSATLLVNIRTPGRYAFVCTYHSSAGMKGELVVLKRP